MAERTEEKEKQKTAVAVAYEPGNSGAENSGTGKGKVQNALSRQQRKMTLRFIRTISWQAHWQSLRSGARSRLIYEVVAEILVFVDDMDRMKAKLQDSGLL